MDEDNIPEDITMTRGPVWVMVSVPSAGDEGFDVKVEVGPALDMESVKALLRKTLEAL